MSTETSPTSLGPAAAAGTSAKGENGATFRRPPKEPKKTLNRDIPLQAPKVIVKRNSSRGYDFRDTIPSPDKKWSWYMADPVEVSTERLEAEMQVAGRRWFATDLFGYELMKKVKCPTDDRAGDEQWVCVPVLRDPTKPTYWIGHRVEKVIPKVACIVLSVAEMYLKSAVHQGRMYAALVAQVQRIIGRSDVVQAGCAVEIRGARPTDEQLKVICLQPGVANVYEPTKENRFGKLLLTGYGGIPILHDQPGLCLLSGGIDSPVAAYRMMTRGVHVNCVHFLNSTTDTAAVIDKNRRIVQVLSRIQGTMKLHFVDIGALQSQIVALVPNHNRTLVYKWFMLNIAAAMDDARILITGDSLGQVASQTIGNIATLYSTTNKAICAPLIGTAKRDITHCAQTIGTLDESIVQASDCCQYMMCKRGANLFIGPRSLRDLVGRIEMRELGITTETFVDGKLVSTVTSSTFKPAVVSRRNKIEVRESDTTATCVYFDAAAGTPTAPCIYEVMAAAPHGNPNSLHTSGRQARMAVEKVRTDLATMLGVPAQDIIFTSGGTESNNIALQGFRVIRDKWSHPSTIGGNGESRGTVKVVDLVNHETGVVNRDLRRPAGVDRLHVDACQALCKIDMSTLDLSQVDSMSFSAHKINGPQGLGVLYIRNLDAQPLFFGGLQEKGIRPGTENVPAIVGLGTALRLDRTLSQHREVEAYLVTELLDMGLPVNRPKGCETSGYIVHTTLPEGFINHEVVAKLSAVHHVEVGTGSACKTNEENISVYEHLGIEPTPVKRSLRLSWDFNVRMDEAIHVTAALRDVLGMTVATTAGSEEDVEPANS